MVQWSNYGYVYFTDKLFLYKPMSVYSSDIYILEDKESEWGVQAVIDGELASWNLSYKLLYEVL